MNNMPITLILIIANVIFSIMGWTQHGYMERFKFHVGSILYQKDFKRLVTGKFLHADWSHLFFNMLTLYVFGEFLEPFYRIWLGPVAPLAYLGLYFGSMLGGGLLALYLKRKNAEYSAIGASGAIAGVVFAYVILDPQGWINAFFFIPMPNWLYAFLYVGYSIYGIQRQLGNIGHDAHLGGAMAGMLLNFAFFYRISLHNWPFLLLLGLPTLIMIYLIDFQPQFMAAPIIMIKSWFKPSTVQSRASAATREYEREQKVKQDGLEVNRRANLQKEMDQLLDKISRKGYANLNPSERARLDQLGKHLGRSTNFDGGRAPSE